jgi:cardiolipin synthase
LRFSLFTEALLMSFFDQIEPYWEILTAGVTALGPILTIITIGWALATKKDSTSAVAWCLVIFFLPILGPFLFLLFGYQHVNRPLKRKREHKRDFQLRQTDTPVESTPAPVDAKSPFVATDGAECSSWDDLAHLARRLGAFPTTDGNRVQFYFAGEPAISAMIEAIESARHHVHLEKFIFQTDATGRRVLDALARKAREGVEVRLLYDAMGTRHLSRGLLAPLRAAGGKCCVFLPINPLRRRLQINMRNHRKILVVDGRTAFTGGLNIGDEYVSRSPRFGYWRDTHMRIEGPAVAGLQRVFSEDWDFAADENLQGPQYFPRAQPEGDVRLQVITSGPDQELKGIREMYFAAILRAREHVWIASPYFVPDAGLLDALCLAGYLGVDVRFLGLYHPDKWIPYFAARFHWRDVLAAGVKVYQYTRGMMHSKVIMVDGEWASVGTANLDNRSLHLNFEVNCLIYSPAAVRELETAYLRDLQTAIRLDPRVYANRPFAGRLLDNACRLLSPVL